MEITFLGTSDMKPTAKRNQTAILLKYDAENILFDCGEGTQRQFRIAGINPCKLTRLLITHWHGDHVLGISGLFQTLAQNEYNKTVHIYGPIGTKEYFGRIMNLFKMAGELNAEIHEINTEGKFFENEDFVLEAYKLKHRTHCIGYVFREKEKTRIDKDKIKKLKISGPIVGELQAGKNVKFNGKTIKSSDVTYTKEGKKIGIIMDTAMCNNCYKIAEGADILISEATFSSELKEKAEEYMHMTVEGIAQVAKKANAKKLILTHLSQRYDGREKKIIAEAKKIFKNSEMAYDLMKVEI